MRYVADFTDEDRICHRGPEGCAGEVFARTSQSGLTRAWICERHAELLEGDLRAVASRYPEVDHPDQCQCHGCRDAW
jgi:hypothetical protein